MIHPADLQRLTRDWNAAFAANDNDWQPDRFDDDEGLDAFMRDLGRMLRGVGYALFAVAVTAMCVVAFRMGASI